MLPTLPVTERPFATPRDSRTERLATLGGATVIAGPCVGEVPPTARDPAPDVGTAWPSGPVTSPRRASAVTAVTIHAVAVRFASIVRFSGYGADGKRRMVGLTHRPTPTLPEWALRWEPEGRRGGPIALSRTEPAPSSLPGEVRRPPAAVLRSGAAPPRGVASTSTAAGRPAAFADAAPARPRERGRSRRPRSPPTANWGIPTASWIRRAGESWRPRT